MMMMIIIYIAMGFIYLFIGMVIAHKKWEWDGYCPYSSEIDQIIVSVFWPVWLAYFVMKTIIEELF